ncbi:NAD(P)-dependent alcohol dehydrogenase, partial [Colletotrichum scovillei]
IDTSEIGQFTFGTNFLDVPVVWHLLIFLVGILPHYIGIRNRDPSNEITDNVKDLVSTTTTGQVENLSTPVGIVLVINGMLGTKFPKKIEFLL